MVDLLEQGHVVFGSIVLSRTAEAASKAGRDPYIDFMTHPMETGGLDVPGMQTMLGAFQAGCRSPNKRGIEGNRPVLVKICANRRRFNRCAELYQECVGHRRQWDRCSTCPEYRTGSSGYSDRFGTPSLLVSLTLSRWVLVHWWLETPPPLLGSPEEEYIRKADIWPIDPQGELTATLTVEDTEGVSKVRDIAQHRWSSIIAVGSGTFAQSYGRDPAAVENAVQIVLTACEGFNVPCSITVNRSDIEKRVKQGFRVLMTLDETEPTITLGKKAAGR